MLSGIYRGVVTDKDTTSLNRLKVSVPLITGLGSVWAMPCYSEPGAVPEDIRVGDGVWVMFEAGDRAFPVWVGFYGTRDR